MAKILFIPFSLLGSLVAGLAAKKLFDGVWSLVDGGAPPDPSERWAGTGKMLAAAALEGAVFSATRAAADHSSRRAFRSVTGSWPGVG